MIQIEQFIRLDDWAGAMQARNRALPVLGGYNAMALQYWIEQRAGNEDFARLCFLKTLSVPLDSTRVEWLAAMLIRAPDATCFAALDAAAFRQAMSLSRSDGAALWVAALVGKDRDAAARWAAFLGADGTLSVPDYVDVDFTAIDWTDPRSAQFLMSFLPLPREVVHALGARIEPRSSRRD